MEKEVLRAMEGIGIYPVISLIIFFSFFIAVIIYAVKQDKTFMNKMSELPLEDDNETFK